MTIKCPYYGFEIPASASYCPYNTADASENTETSETKTVSEPIAQQKPANLP